MFSPFNINNVLWKICIQYMGKVLMYICTTIKRNACQSERRLQNTKTQKSYKLVLTEKTITSFAIVWRASQKSLTATWHSRFKVWRRSIKFIQNANSGFVGVAPQRLKRRSRRKSASQPQNWTWTSFWSPEEIYNTNGAVNFSLLSQK